MSNTYKNQLSTLLKYFLLLIGAAFIGSILLEKAFFFTIGVSSSNLIVNIEDYVKNILLVLPFLFLFSLVTIPLLARKNFIYIAMITVIILMIGYGFYKGKANLKDARENPEAVLVTKKGEEFPIIKAYNNFFLVESDNHIRIISIHEFLLITFPKTVPLQN